MTTPLSSVPAPLAAESLGKYRLLAELGQGGMADVYLALARGPSKFVKLSVIKRLKRDLADEPDALGMFLSEAQLAARLNHPNVVQTFEVGEEGDRPHLVMEYLEGQSLDRLLRRAPADDRSLPCLLRALSDALLGLHYAHELRDYDGTPLGVVHRDVSPRNVFVTYEGQTKVLDFGIAKALRASHVSRAGTLKGTVRYMAPEQVLGREIDRRADLFAVGVLLWELVAGRRMWPGLEDVVILQRLLRGQIPPLGEARPDAPAELARVCERALAFEPDRRYPSAREMHAELEAAIAARHLGATPAELGALAAGLFRDEREALRRLIEQQLARAPAGEGGAPAREPIAAAAWAGGAFAPAAHEALAAPPSGFPRVPHSAPPPGSYTTGAPGAVASTGSAGGRRLFLRIAGPAGVAAIALAAFGTSRLGGRAPPPPTEAAATAPSSPAPPGAQTSVELRVFSRPARAQVYLDARPLGDAPLTAILPRGGEHELRLEAPGHQALAQRVSLEHDVAIEVVLSRAGAAAASPPRPTGAKADRPDPAGARLLEAAPPAKRVPPPIDKSSPYSTVP
ncbi:MAG TPA: serine/threonine-protein kinase [Polyangiaceae bacterium]|nr:serine/threonine-protein kinase [Polyangiaceae bacterium]